MKSGKDGQVWHGISTLLPKLSCCLLFFQSGFSNGMGGFGGPRGGGGGIDVSSQKYSSDTCTR